MNMEYEPVIGLEIHLQLSTHTKVFCNCKNRFGDAPNTNVCPVCLGLPGVLPVLNKHALESGIKVALALGCKIDDIIKFDRKNYYYPDLPKSYQISQYDRPIGQHGKIEISVNGKKKVVRIKRVHLEEDAGKLIHDNTSSLVDLNRAGVSLLEVVSEPDIFSPDEAYEYLTTLKSIFEYLEVSDCNMEAGSLRCDANLSIRPKGADYLGVKVEVKNMNSFKGVRSALAYEVLRQQKALNAGEKLTQQTRLWDAEKQTTLLMRSKEEAHDYRYFPEPDLVPFVIPREEIKKIADSICELPHNKSLRFQNDYKISEYDANVLTASKPIADYFDNAVKLYPRNPKILANWIMGDIQAYLNENGENIEAFSKKIPTEKIIELVKLIDENIISSKLAKDVFVQMIETGLSAGKIVEEKGLKQISNPLELELLADDVIKENPESVKDYCSGKDRALIFLVGKFMAKTKGKANPKMANDLLKEKLQKIKEGA